jgi:hypothetical protein
MASTSSQENFAGKAAGHTARAPHVPAHLPVAPVTDSTVPDWPGTASATARQGSPTDSRLMRRRCHQGRAMKRAPLSRMYHLLAAGRSPTPRGAVSVMGRARCRVACGRRGGPAGGRRVGIECQAGCQPGYWAPWHTAAIPAPGQLLCSTAGPLTSVHVGMEDRRDGDGQVHCMDSSPGVSFSSWGCLCKIGTPQWWQLGFCCRTESSGQGQGLGLLLP